MTLRGCYEGPLAKADACPGAGKCHGPVVWCERCGHVVDVCDAYPCSQHRHLDPEETEDEYRDAIDYVRRCEAAAARARATMQDVAARHIKALRRADRSVPVAIIVAELCGAVPDEDKAT